MGRRDRRAAAAYAALYRLGFRSPRRAEPAAVRLARRTDRELGQPNPEPLGRCWEWTGALNTGGYGVIKVAGRVVLVRRLSLEISLGRPLGEGMFSCHRCDNRRCLRPRHLYEGTAEDNARDCVERGRHRGFETRRPLLEELLAEIEAEAAA
ncbi:MAG: HNH endonuclease [Chloroflexota bacterium]